MARRSKDSGRCTNVKASHASNAEQRSAARPRVGDRLTGARSVSGGSVECYNQLMKIKIIVHEAEEGGYWAEVPAIPGCASQGETVDELLRNVHEAIEGCLAIDLGSVTLSSHDRVMEIAV